MRLHHPLVGATAALAALTLSACGSPGPGAPGASPAADDGVVTVVASTNVYGAIAEAVGGEDVTVESIITDPAADPHSYESTPADAAIVSDADVVIRNGGGYDAFMPQLLEATDGSPAVIDVAELSGLVPAEEAGEEHAHGELNEHLWYSLPTVQQVATRLAAELGTVDPAGAATYTANAQAFAGEVASLQERVEAIGPSVEAGRVAVTEPIPAYLIETAGLTDVTPPEFSEAVEEDTDPPAAVVAETLALFAPGAEPIEALILNSQTQTPTTEQVRQAARAGGVPVVEMSETLPDGAAGYLAWMGSQVDALSAALNPV
ncbi:MAG: zinc ABC transporter substrate-binding protein [Pseudonocardia sp.]|nr:zinc ABC transporter substrate-binding protein [Pseudonocardia sp.]